MDRHTPAEQGGEGVTPASDQGDATLASIEDAPPHLAAQLERLITRYGVSPLNGGGKPLDKTSVENRRKHLLYAFAELAANGRTPAKLEEIRPADIDVVVKSWIRAGLTRGTLASRMSSIRALGRWLGKPDLGRYRMKSRMDVEEVMLGATQVVPIDEDAIMEKIDKLREQDESVALQLEFVWRFGISVGEAIQLRPHKDIRNEQLYVVRGTPRNIPRPPMPIPGSARLLVERAQAFAMTHRGLLHPPKRTLMQLRKHFYALLRQGGFNKSERLTATDLRLASQRMQQASAMADRELSMKRLLSVMEGLQSNDIRKVEYYVRTHVLCQPAA